MTTSAPDGTVEQLACSSARWPGVRTRGPDDGAIGGMGKRTQTLPGSHLRRNCLGRRDRLHQALESIHPQPSGVFHRIRWRRRLEPLCSRHRGYTCRFPLILDAWLTSSIRLLFSSWLRRCSSSASGLAVSPAARSAIMIMAAWFGMRSPLSAGTPLYATDCHVAGICISAVSFVRYNQTTAHPVLRSKVARWLRRNV